MTNSTLAQLRALLEYQIEIEPTDVNTNPSRSMLNKYVNLSILKVAQTDSPVEIQNPDTVSINISANTNQSAMPSLLNIQFLYYKTATGKYRKLFPKSFAKMIEAQGAESFFDTGNTGDPEFYSIRGSKLVFNKYFNRSETGALKAIGDVIPSDLVNETDESVLSKNWDMLIVYESAVLFYQRDDDEQNQTKFMEMARQERGRLRIALDSNNAEVIEMDDTVFHGSINSFRDPGVMFQ